MTTAAQQREIVMQAVSKLPEEGQAIILQLASALIDTVNLSGQHGMYALALASAELAVQAQAKVKPADKPRLIVLGGGKPELLS